LPAHRPLVMGVLNVTPDSFSDGGWHLAASAAIEAGRVMLGQGADLLDIGGESTRPGAAPTAPDIEQARVLPVIAALAASGAMLSVDTRNASTMAHALAAGARIINDVSALRHDSAAAGVLAASDCQVILMHMRGDPTDMTTRKSYGDIAEDVTEELADRVAFAVNAGIALHRIAVDPGIGFAKGLAENLALLPRLSVLGRLGCPIVVGVSRKGFIGRLSGEADPAKRAPGSIAAGIMAVQQGASMLRVHDVAETVQAVRVWRALVSSNA
jgi:dihydropteroate synthase